MRYLIALALITLPASAHANDRRIGVGSYSSVRVEGPFDVRIMTGKSPGAVVSGDSDAIERVDVALSGDALVVRIGSSGWGETPRRAPASATIVTLTTPTIDTLRIGANAKVSIDRMRGDDVSVALAGGGALTAGAIMADRVNVTQQGAGIVTVAGKAGRVRLTGSGAGSIDASGLVANDLLVAHDGTGDLMAAARYTADVTNSGLGAVTVTGPAKCVIRGRPAGPVRCGK